MKKILLSLSLLAVSFNSKSQDWAEYIQRPDANLYQAQAMFHQYWQGKDSTEKGKGYKAFKRWEHFAEPRVYPSGNLSLLGLTAKNYQEFLDTYTPPVTPQIGGGGKYGNIGGENLIASTTWTAMGPFGPLAGNAGGQLLKAGRINFVATHPTNTLNLYCGAPAGGFWRSTNAGASWTTNTDALPVNGCSDLAIDPTNTNVMYLATGDGDAGDTRSTGVLKSLDGGATWAVTGLTNLVTNNFLIRRLVINPTSTQTLLAATNSGIRRTINGGTSWNTPDGSNCYDIEFRPGTPATVYAAGATFRKSTDGGATWVLISAGIPTTGINRMAIAVTPNNPSVVYVLASASSGSGFQGFYRSLDSGTTFSLMASTPNLLGWATAGNDSGGQGWYDLCIAASPTNSLDIVTGGVNVWRTIDGGTSWSIYGHWTGTGAPFTHADHHDLEYDAAGNLYNTNDGTIYRRAGATWAEVSGTMNISQIYKIGTSGMSANRWITGHQDNGTSFWNGVTYSAALGGDGMDCFIDRTNDNNMFGEYQNGAFRRSTNGGASWSNYTTGMSGGANWVSIWKQDPQSANTLYAGYQNMFRSILGSGSWTIMTALPAAGGVREFAIAPSNSLVIYVLKSGGIYKTINGGTSWTTITGTVPVGSASPEFVTIDPTDPNNAWVVLSGYSAGNKVFRTTDGGATWTNFTANLPNLPANCSVYQVGTNDRIYVGMDVGIYYRDNIAANWTLYNIGLPNTPISDMEISPADPTKLIAATYGRGVWKVDVIANLTPVTNFSFSGTQCAAAPMQFTDLTLNAPTSWAWSVLPALGVTINTPASQNPTITFANAGTYTVTLSTTNGVGPGTTASQTLLISSSPTVVISNTLQSICAGSTVNINSSGATTYSWNNGATTSVIAVSPVLNTTYTLIGYNGLCASLPKTATVNVTASPTVVVNSPSICIGGSVVLTASGATSYSWNVGPVTNTIMVSPAVTTTYVVTGTTGICNNVKTATVTVSPNPTVVISNTLQSICAGASVNINSSGATTYSWSNGATTSIIAVSPSISTIYTLTGYNGLCASLTKTATVNVTPSPTVVLNNTSFTVCAGSSVGISASGATSYLWNTGSTATLINVTPSVTSVYTVTGLNGGCTGVNTATVTLNALPNVAASANDSTICKTEVVNLTGVGALTYTWQPGNQNGGIISNSPTVTTIYTVSGTDANGCVNTSTLLITVLDCGGTGILMNGNESVSLIVYPNPASDNISILFPSSNDAEVSMDLMDVTGKLIARNSHNFSKTNATFNFDLISVANGIYFLKFKVKDGESRTIKIVKL